MTGVPALRVWSKSTLKSLIVPGGIVLLGAVLLAYSGWLTLALPALSFLYYCALFGGMLLAWRFHSSRTFFALLVLFLAQQAVALFGGAQFAPGTAGFVAVCAVAVLVPLNFALIALMQERGFTSSAAAPVGIMLFVQFVIVAVLCRSAEGTPVSLGHAHHAAASVSLPAYALFAFIAASVTLLARFLLSRKPADSALLWSLAAFFWGLHFTGTPRISTLYSVTAACILAVSIMENSYLLAYHDELTTLPSRRAFNDALLRLQHPYSIAVVDIDHFKRFNDTYGHDTGDQVLRLVAAGLARVTGGGEAFRCGGEEFNILFPGKTAVQVMDHAEQLRAAIESSEFRMRAGDRRQVPRGPERRRSSRKGDAIRQLAGNSASSPLSVTISIGVASSSKTGTDPESVLQAADKALYRAKANGRNRVETTSAPPRRTRTKAAGIA
ncbi:MAG TPA: GGDEF domain-containing protein [Candidatus Sulfotelmatobacter sp.]|nr:GGDEF domain-containing protein [Candidatus Sulfotelmatobacter sp.]